MLLLLLLLLLAILPPTVNELAVIGAGGRTYGTSSPVPVQCSLLLMSMDSIDEEVALPFSMTAPASSCCCRCCHLTEERELKS
jgi:hypothetical protein